MLLDLNKPFEINKFKTYAKKLLEDKAKVNLTKIMPKRTARQNRYEHALFSLFAIEFGMKTDYVKQVVFKIEVNRTIFLVLEQVGTETFQRWRSTADLDTAENTLAIERFRNFSNEQGCYLPDASEYLEQAFYIDQEIDKNKLYL